MSNQCMISIVIPIYNAQNTLKRCLDSILEQTYMNYEVLMVDDGSKDKSGGICDDYAQKDSRFKVIHTENKGVSSARNTGLDNITGQYVMFIDSDDYVYPDYLETYIHAFNTSKSNVLLGGLVRVERDGKMIKTISPIGTMSNEIWKLICSNPEMYGYIAGKMIQSDIIKENGIRLNEKMYSQEDLDFNLSVYEKCIRFEIIDYAGYEYEYTSGKRKPPVWDFIANSLKMYRIATSKIELSEEAKSAIKDRIVSQIFTFLYNSKDKEEYEFAINKLNNVTGLTEYLRMQSITGESKYVIKWYIQQQYKTIYTYFKVRKMIKKILGKPVSE